MNRRKRPLFIDITLGIIFASFMFWIIDVAFGIGGLAVLTSALEDFNHKENLKLKQTSLKPFPIYGANQAQKVILDMGQANMQNALRIQKQAIENMPKSREQIVKEESRKVIMQARTETEDFRDHYQKPERCYNIKDKATRMFCANDFIRARKTWESQH